MRLNPLQNFRAWVGYRLGGRFGTSGHERASFLESRAVEQHNLLRRGQSKTAVPTSKVGESLQLIVDEDSDIRWRGEAFEEFDWKTLAGAGWE